MIARIPSSLTLLASALASALLPPTWSRASQPSARPRCRTTVTGGGVAITLGGARADVAWDGTGRAAQVAASTT